MKREVMPGSLQERTQLEERKALLETQIQINANDSAAQSKIREEYRQVIDRLSIFYDDIKSGEASA